MRQRHISEAAVAWVLEHYDLSRPAPRGTAPPATIYIGIFEGRELKVYVENGTNPMLVKTVVAEE